jgi:hypothetical protein
MCLRPSRFRLGRQEDSHEYLRCLLDAMHEACLARFKPEKPPPALAATTFVHRIFGGRLRSQVRPQPAGALGASWAAATLARTARQSCSACCAGTGAAV